MIISIFVAISSCFLNFLQKKKCYKDIQHLILKPCFKALKWSIISPKHIFSFWENQEIMQQTQNHSKQSFWYFLVRQTSNQLQTWGYRTFLDKHISITANTHVLRCIRKHSKALKSVFHVIPAYKIPWTEKWFFASVCNVCKPLAMRAA